MKQYKILLKIKKWLAIQSILVLFISIPQVSYSQTNILVKSISSPTQKLNFKPPSRGAPGERNDAGSRFPQTDAFLPIIPQSNLGLTISSYPTFWLYLSPQFNCHRLGFTLLENSGKTDKIFYQTKIKISQEKGLISFSLPASAPPLQIGESYRWIFSCGANARYGEIERIKLTQQLTQQLNQANPREKIEILAANGIWYETLTTLIDLRTKYPQDEKIQENWSNLLQDSSVGLEELTTLFP